MTSLIHRRPRPHFRIGVAFAAMLLPLVSVLAPPASAQAQGVGLGITPIFPGVVVVGQNNVNAQLSIINNSSGVGPITLTEITLNPSCLDLVCATPDLGVLGLSATGTGSSGSCATLPFTITGPDANGRSVFTPAGSVVLQPPNAADDDTCIINFSFNVLRVPTLDADPGPGIQTRDYATTAGFGFTPLNERLEGTGTGTSITTVSQRQPLINTRASGPIAAGATVTDTATLTLGFNPTGTILFQLFGPDNAMCVGTPVFTSTVPVNGNGEYVSAPPFVVTAVGTYSWIASYSGDNNNSTAGPGACAEVVEQVVVSRQPPPPTTTIPPVATTVPPVTTTTLPSGVLPLSPPPTVAPNRLVRTGSPLVAQTGVAILLVMIGAHLLVSTLRRREGANWPNW